MGKNLKVYIILLVVLLGFIVFVEYTADKPINWAKTYNENDKIPYGTFVFHDQLNQLFPNTEIERINTSAYEYFDALNDYENDDYDISGNYIQVEEFADIDARIIKETFTVAKKAKDYATLIKLRNKVIEVAEIKTQHENNDVEFLTIVLKDYSFYTQNM